MRRVLGVFAAALCLLCCGCQHTGSSKKDYTLPAAFSADICAVHGTHTFETAFSMDAAGTAVARFTSPEAVHSLEITQTPDHCRFAFLGLSLETPPALLPDTSFVKLLYSVCMTLRESTRYVEAVHSDCVVFSGMTEDGDAFTLTCSKESGAPETLTVDRQNLQVTFRAFTPQ